MHILLSVEFIVHIREESSISVNKPRNLTCEVTGVEGDTAFQWFRNGISIDGETSAILFFSAPRQTDSGVYVCEGSRNSTRKMSNSVNITVTINGGKMLVAAIFPLLAAYMVRLGRQHSKVILCLPIS